MWVCFIFLYRKNSAKMLNQTSRPIPLESVWTWLLAIASFSYSRRTKALGNLTAAPAYPPHWLKTHLQSPSWAKRVRTIMKYPELCVWSPTKTCHWLAGGSSTQFLPSILSFPRSPTVPAYIVHSSTWQAHRSAEKALHRERSSHQRTVFPASISPELQISGNCNKVFL